MHLDVRAAPFAVQVTTADIEEARAVCSAHLYPHSVRLLEPGGTLAARFTFLHVGPLTIGDMRYGAAVAGSCRELGHYHVNLPLRGSFTARQAGRAIAGAAG